MTCLGQKSEILALHIRNLSLSTANDLSSSIVVVAYLYDDLMTHYESSFEIIIFKN